MKNIFNNQVVRMVRDEVNDLRKKNKGTPMNQETSLTPSGVPTYYYHPSSTSSTIDSYSHTANSTAGYSQTNTYPTLATYSHERDTQTLRGKVESTASNVLGNIESTATNILGNIVGQDTAVSATHKINSVVTNGRNARELLQNGVVIQLLSKSSGHLLQVVMSTNGTLTFDGNGAMNSFNTYFTIEESEKGRFRLHNNYNYLAFEGKLPCIMSFPPGAKNNPSIDFRVHDIIGTNELVALESCAFKNNFISVTNNGHLKITNIKDKNIDAQFSVIPIKNNQQAMFSYQQQPYQQINMNPYGTFSSHNANEYVPPQPPMSQTQPSAPPPPYSVQDPYSQPSTSSGLYPQFH